MGRAKKISAVEFRSRILANANKERAAKAVAEAKSAGLQDKSAQVDAVKDAIQKLNPGKSITTTKARRFIEKGAISAVKDAFDAIDEATKGLQTVTKDELLKDAIAEATGMDVSKLKRVDVQKYRKEAAVDKLSSTFAACKDAGMDDCLADAKVALKKSLGRSKNVTSTELNRYRRRAAMAKVAALKSACLNAGMNKTECKKELKDKVKDLVGKDVDDTSLQKIVRKGAEGTAREFMSSCGGAAREAYEKSKRDDDAKTALRKALKECRTGDVKEGLLEALGEKDASAIDEEDVIEFAKEGIGSHAATVMDACVEAAAGNSNELKKCNSVENLKNTLIEASGDPLVEADDAVKLKRQLVADAFVGTQEAANDAAAEAKESGVEDTKAMNDATKEAKDLFLAQTGLNLDEIDATEIKEDAMARSIADAAKACVDAESDCADDVIEKAANMVSGIMTDEEKSGGRRLSEDDEKRKKKKKAAKRMRDKKFGVIKIIQDRTDACLEAGKDESTIKACRDDPRVKKTRGKIRPAHKEKADNREQRAKAAMDAMANCKRAESDKCEEKAKEKAKKLLPKVSEKADEESWESMKGKYKKKRMRRLVKECDTDKKAVCKQSAKDDLKKDLGVDGKEIEMIKRQSAAMIASDEIAACEDAIDSNKGKVTIDSVDADCLGFGKEVFIAAGSSEDAWTKKVERIKKLAKAKFAGKSTDVIVNKKQVDTFFEADAVSGKCDEATVEQARNDIGNAAKKGDTKGKGETVVKSKGVDSASSKCRVVFATKVSEGKHEDAAASINQAKEIGKKKGKRFRSLNAGGETSVSSSPSSEEVPNGESPESTDFSNGGVSEPKSEESISPSGSGGDTITGDDKGDGEMSGSSLVLPFWGASSLSAVLAMVLFSAVLEH